jgi:serine/threonine protein kinase
MDPTIRVGRVAVPTAAVAPTPGTVIAGRYRVGGSLARGGMGAVHGAVDVQTGEEVAVKTMLDLRDAARFESEARVLARLDHPRIVRLRDYVQDAASAYLVMDLVRGPDLEEVAPVRLDDAIAYVAQAAEALEYLHSEHVVHRDVKPRNLMLVDGEVVLVDLGIARPPTPRAATIGIGTPGFIAPETALGVAVSERTDVYGLAATLCALLTGTVPVPGEVPEKVPARVVPALRAGLHPDPNQRPPGVRAFAELLGVEPAPLEGRPLAAGVAVLEEIVRAAAGVFEAAAASIALAEPDGSAVVFQASWGAGADEILGVRRARGEGLAGAAFESGEPMAMADCRADPRFSVALAASTGYIPHTMLLVPLRRDGKVIGVLSLLDRRSGEPYGAADIARGEMFADVAAAAIG